MSQLHSQVGLGFVALVAAALFWVSTAAYSRTPTPSGGRGQGAAAPAAPATPAAGPSTRGSSSGARGAAPARQHPQRAHSPFPSQTRAHRVHPQPYYRGSRAGVFWSAPIISAPWWYYPDPYYAYGPAYHPPAVPVYEEPMVYIEQPPLQSAPVQASGLWYYCEDSKTYFPYVQTCASPWVRVMPHAPQP